MEVSCVYLFVLLIVESLSNDYREGLDYVVSVVEQKTGQFRCMGGIVTTKAIITSCRCVGTFLPPDMYDFVQIDPKEHAVKRSWVHMYGIEKVFAHIFCRPTSWNYTVNDLGGWIIRGSFDSGAKCIVPFFARTVPFKRIDSKIKNCYVTWYKNLVFNLSEISGPGESLACFRVYSRTEFQDGTDRDYFLVNVYNDDLQCGFVTKDTLYTQGSPILCSSDNAKLGFFALGVVSRTADIFSFWTRFDLKANHEFYLDLMEAGAACFQSFPAFIILILANTIHLFK